MAVEKIYSNSSNVINFSATTVWNMIRDAMQVPNWHPFMWHNPDYDPPTPNSIGVDHVIQWSSGLEQYMGIYKFFEVEDTPANMYIRYNVLVMISNSEYVGDWDNFVDFTVVPVTENSCQVKLERWLDFGPMPPGVAPVAREKTIWLSDEILGFIAGVEWDSTIEQLRNPNKSPVPPIPVP